MVALDVVKASNSRLHELGPGLVALFVGGTSGIGEAALKAFVRYTDSPRVYLVGRSEPAAEKIIEECKKLNSSGKVEFLKADVRELKEVDRISDLIKAKEQKINLVFQTQSNMNMKGRDESPEGLDRKFTLNYYSRMRFITNLLPLLTPPSTTDLSKPTLSRSVSVLAAGHEAAMNLSDLPLKNSFSPGNCASHSITMNSLMTTQFSALYPSTSFIHTHPSYVRSTGLVRELPVWARIPLKMIEPLIKPLGVSQEETGERHLYMATNGAFAPKAAMGGEKVNAVKGADGVVGSGGYALEWNCEVTGKPILKKYMDEGVGKTVWEHTFKVLEDVSVINKGRV